MSRSTVAVLAVAAVVGLGGGSLAAVALEDAGLDDHEAAGSAPGGDLLYADARAIHDGDTVVDHDVPVGLRSRLVRVDDGWVLAQALSEQSVELALWHVSRTGERNLVARVGSTWDVDPTGRRVTGVDLESGRVGVWSLTGDLVGLAPDLPSPVWSSYFTADRVVVTTVTPDRGWVPWTWRTGDDLEPRRTVRVSPAEPFASRDGALVAGGSDREGFATAAGPTPCLRVVPAPAAARVSEWQTCDWRPEGQSGGFSPDGLRVMGIPADSDGFGPGQLATFSSGVGPREGLAVIDLPERSLGAEWLDDRHVVVTAATDNELDDRTGTVLYRCTLAGDCTEVARRDTGVLVVGEQY